MKIQHKIRIQQEQDLRTQYKKNAGIQQEQEVWKIAGDEDADGAVCEDIAGAFCQNKSSADAQQEQDRR